MSHDPHAGPAWSRQLACPAELAHLPQLLALVRTACLQLQAPAEAEHDLLLMAEEACVNVMRHAYPAGAPGPIELLVRATGGGETRGIELTLRDQGRPFDPLAASTPDVAMALEDRAVGGLGVHLIRQLADRLQYRYDPLHGNVLVIEKFLPATDPD